MTLAASLTESQLVIAGLMSGGGVVAFIVRWATAAPEREAAAYRAGVADEAARSDRAEEALRVVVAEQGRENANLRQALLRLALTVEMTAYQRAEVAAALGYKNLTIAARDELGGGQADR